MLVRDKSLPKSDYKGRPTQALDSLCPCRPCWNPHDCGYIDSQGKWHIRMECATRWNHGCPSVRDPSHLLPPRVRICKRCGARKPKTP